MTIAEAAFHWVPTAAPWNGRLVYVASDYGINFRVDPELERSEPVFWDQGCSLALQTLELHVACATGTVLFPRGYFPKTMWKAGSLPAVPAAAGKITVVPGSLQVGVAEPLAEADEWVAVHDSSTGWLRFGAPDPLPADGTVFVEFAAGAVLELVRTGVSALWMRPESE